MRRPPSRSELLGALATVEKFIARSEKGSVSEFPLPGQSDWLVEGLASFEALTKAHREFLDAGGRAAVVLAQREKRHGEQQKISMFSIRDPEKIETLHQWIMSKSPDWNRLNASVVGPWLVYHEPSVDLRELLSQKPNPRLVAAVKAIDGAPFAFASAEPMKASGNDKDAISFLSFDWNTVVFETRPAGVRLVWTDGQNQRFIRVQAGVEPLPAVLRSSDSESGTELGQVLNQTHVDSDSFRDESGNVHFNQ